MAGGQIRITPEQLKGEATRLGGLADQHDQVFGQMTNLVNALKSQWEGQALQAFENSYDTAKVELKKFRDAIDIFIKRMNTAADQLNQTDINLSNSFK